MPVARTRSVALLGLSGSIVEVEADLSSQLPAFIIIGLPDAALGEARDRVRSAAINAGCPLPSRRLTVNLSPAALPKHGSGFDLAIAVACLAAAGELSPESVDRVVHLGELGLDGRLRPIDGILPAVLAAARAGHDTVMVPAGNATEAALVPGIRGDRRRVAARGRHLARRRIRRTRRSRRCRRRRRRRPTHEVELPGDLADVSGNDDAVEGMLVAAAGGHHVYLLGPPGAGKTMLASRLPGILPDLDADAALEVASIRSLAGMRPGVGPLVPAAVRGAAPHGDRGGDGRRRQSPHPAGRGRARLARRAVPRRGARVPVRGARRAAAAARVGHHRDPPGERRGELPGEVPARARRQPVPVRQRRHGRVHVSADRPTSLPRPHLRPAARPRRRAAAGAAHHPGGRCAPRASSPACRAPTRGRSVIEARAVAAERLRGTPWRTNAEMPGPWMRGAGRLHPGGRATAALDRSLERGGITMRGYDRVLKVAWTLSDLDGTAAPRRRARHPGAVLQEGNRAMNTILRLAAEHREVLSVRCGPSAVDRPSRAPRADRARRCSACSPSPATACSAAWCRALGAVEAADLLLARCSPRELVETVGEAGETIVAEGSRRWPQAMDTAHRRGAVHTIDGQAARVGARFLIPGDAEWPAGIDDLGRHAPLGLWVRGRARRARRRLAVDRPRRCAGRDRVRRARRRRGVGRAVRSRVRRGVGRRIRHRRHGAPCRARERRHDGRVPRRRHRPVLPDGPRVAADPHRVEQRGGHLRGAVRYRPDEMAVPRAQSADRRGERRDRRARGGPAVGIDQHRRARLGSRSAARRSARAGDEPRIGRMPPPVARVRRGLRGRCRADGRARGRFDVIDPRRARIRTGAASGSRQTACGCSTN